MSAKTITDQNKQLPINEIDTIKTHSDIAVLVTTKNGEQYFAGMVLHDHVNGVVTLTPVEDSYENDLEDDEYYLTDDDYFDVEDEFLP